MKKGILILLSVIIALFTGCSGDTTVKPTATPAVAQTTAAATTPEVTENPLGYLNLEGYRPVVLEGKIPLTGITVVHDTQCIGDPNDSWWIAFVNQVMNVQIELEYVTQSAAAEKKNLLFASDDLPDLVMAMGLNASELVKYGQIEGQLLALNPYIEQYMPSMLALKANFPTMLANMTCPDGNIYSFPRMLSYVDPGSVGKVFVNVRWLDALDMIPPATLDEFYDMLSAFVKCGSPCFFSFR